MMLTMLKSKIHRAKVVESDLHYEGSIKIDSALLKASNILPGEQVDVLNITNGQRWTTYAIIGEENSGMIGVNGAAARLVQEGDLVIICAYAGMDEEEAKAYQPIVVSVDDNNKALA